MKAQFKKTLLMLAFFAVLTAVVLPTAVKAQYSADPTPNNSQKTFRLQGGIKTQPATPATQSAGQIKILPSNDSSNPTIQYFDPRTNQNVAFQLAGCGFLDIGGPVGHFCDSVKSFVDFVGDCKADIGCWISTGVEIVQRTIVRQITGCDPQDNDCAAKKKADLEAGIINKDSGLLFQLAAVNGALASIPVPVSTDLYLAHLNPFKAANAQGFNDLQHADTIYKIWQNVRNAAYAFSIVILVVVGFLIMLRTKLDPRTAVSITNSIPKLVIMLILITFSLGIAGLILDFMRLLTQLLLTMIPDITGGTIAHLFVNTVYIIALPLILAIGGTLIGFAPLAVVGLGFSILFILLVAIYMLVVMFMLLYHMTVRYAQFIIGIIFAPLIFLTFPLPNGPELFMTWLKKEIAYILTIPLIVVLIELSFQVANSSNIPSPFTAGIFGTPQGVVSGGLNPFGLFSFIAPFIGLAILSIATKAPRIADDIMGVKPIGGPKGGFGLFGLISGPSQGLKTIYDVKRGVGSIQEFGGTYGKLMTRFGVGSGGGLTPPPDVAGGAIGGGGGGGGGGPRPGGVGRFFRGGVGRVSPAAPSLALSTIENNALLAHGGLDAAGLGNLKVSRPDAYRAVLDARTKQYLAGSGSSIINDVRKTSSKLDGLSPRERRAGITLNGGSAREAGMSGYQQEMLKNAYNYVAQHYSGGRYKLTDFNYNRTTGIRTTTIGEPETPQVPGGGAGRGPVSGAGTT